MAVDAALKRRNAPTLMRHICNGAAAIRFSPEYLLEGVRFGLWLYGLGSPEFVDVLRPALKLRTVVAHLHTLPAGETLGYGGTFAADTPRTIATLPIGYADGFLRAYRDRLVTVHTASGDVSAQLVGRICMDQCMIDVTDLPVALGDTVTLFGTSAREVAELAAYGETIEHELICLISARIPRVKV